MSTKDQPTKLKLASIIDALPTFTQVSILYQLLGSLNSSAINSAARQIGREINDLENTKRDTTFSIDRFNELLNELRARELSNENRIEQGFDVLEGTEMETIDNVDAEGERVKLDYLEVILTLRGPLLAMFHSAQSKLPNRSDQAPPDFSFSESLARQLAREFSVQEKAAESIDQELIDSGAVTAEELAEADRNRFNEDQSFKDEFKHLILDRLNDKEPFSTSLEQADEAFQQLGYEAQERMLKRLLPKLIDGKRNNLSRRSFDPDAPTNILLIGYAIKEFKTFLGESEADAKLKKMQELQGA